MFFSKQKTGYEMRIRDWSSDVCSSDRFGDQIARRGVVAHKFVDEGTLVAAAVRVDVGQLGVDPGVAAARIPRKRVILRERGARQQQACGQQCRARTSGV